MSRVFTADTEISICLRRAEASRRTIGTRATQSTAYALHRFVPAWEYKLWYAVECYQASEYYMHKIYPLLMNRHTTRSDSYPEPERTGQVFESSSVHSAPDTLLRVHAA